jgi:hypothetical protein
MDLLSASQNLILKSGFTSFQSSEICKLEGIEVEMNSEIGAPSHIQKAHTPQQIIGNLNERVTWSSRLAHLSYFTNALFVALFEPRDIGHTLSYSSWVNVRNEKFENFERNQV